MFFMVGLIEVWNFDDSKGFDILPVGIHNPSSLFKLEVVRWGDKWRVSFDLTYYRSCVTLINVAVDKAIDYFIWKTLQF